MYLKEDSIFLKGAKISTENLNLIYKIDLDREKRLKLVNLFSVHPLSDWTILHKYASKLERSSRYRSSYYFINKNPLTDVDFFANPKTSQYWFYQRLQNCFLLWEYLGTNNSIKNKTDWQRGQRLF